MEETLLGLDYGESNIGLAFGKSGLVMPSSIISGKNDESAVAEIARFAIENKVDRIVLGLPLNIEGKDTRQSQVVRRFAKLLKIRLKKKIDFVNEYRTTKDSKTTAINLGISKKRRQVTDHISAALILKEYYSRLEN